MGGFRKRGRLTVTGEKFRKDGGIAKKRGERQDKDPKKELGDKEVEKKQKGLQNWGVLVIDFTLKRSKKKKTRRSSVGESLLTYGGKRNHRTKKGK